MKPILNTRNQNNLDGEAVLVVQLATPIASMASQIPTSLKAAEIGRFVTRASQLEQAEPVVAYWCNYWTVQQILAKNLQNADDEAMCFTIATMDKLEKVKPKTTRSTRD